MHGNRCGCHDCDAPIKRSQEEWDLFFYRVAQSVGQDLSKDPDRQVGAVVVTPNRRQLSFGYNGFPAEIEDRPSLLDDREFKLRNMVHAEDNALRQCPFDPRGCALYVTRFPCKECATRIILRGITRVVTSRPDFGHARWGTSWAESLTRMKYVGIEVKTVEW
jgi:dCMP deaminase